MSRSALRGAVTRLETKTQEFQAEVEQLQYAVEIQDRCHKILESAASLQEKQVPLDDAAWRAIQNVEAQIDDLEQQMEYNSKLQRIKRIVQRVLNSLSIRSKEDLLGQNPHVVPPASTV